MTGVCALWIGASIVMLTLWSTLLWELKLGLVALEEAGVDRFELIRGLDQLLDEKASEHPVLFDKQRGLLVLAKTGLPYDGWDFEDLLEPLLQRAEHEAKELGHNWLGSEHLVLAVLQVADPALRILLQSHGITHEQVRAALVHLLQSVA